MEESEFYYIFLNLFKNLKKLIVGRVIKESLPQMKDLSFLSFYLESTKPKEVSETLNNCSMSLKHLEIVGNYEKL
jgi:hypothetical protein